MRKHIFPIKRNLQIELEVESFDPKTDYFLFSISEKPHFEDWSVTFETIEMIYKKAKVLKDSLKRTNHAIKED